MITITQQGEYTTIQDQGRWGYQAYGMPVSGAMDRYSSQVANILVGNSPEAALVEMTAAGAAFKFDEEQLVAVCGANMQGEIDGRPVENWSAFVVPRHSELRFSTALSGYRAYLAVRGGIDVPTVLGSKSTCPRAKVGGYEGRTLRQGDVLYVGQAIVSPAKPYWLHPQYIPHYSEEVVLRMILGPQDNMFTTEVVDAFFSSVYKVTQQADRIIYGLKGPRVKPIGKADIVSDAMCQGAIQIIANGTPVIMTADHQTTGGFAKLGSVIWADLPFLAQAKPGDAITFACVEEQVAIDALQIESNQYHEIVNLAHTKK
ncbi:allophanate hydrolase [Sporomusaceae bacterium FL31]|nr:allophanate hydrolase [Sporomusaceae bacterium FL31]GCE34441.1 allophanate hydrolase [Sporomusaceae bacterium]